jgi:hypothetical protein
MVSGIVGAATSRASLSPVCALPRRRLGMTTALDDLQTPAP